MDSVGTDTPYRGLRINRAGDGTFQVCLDYSNPTQGDWQRSGFYVLSRNWQTIERAQRWINLLGDTILVAHSSESSR